MATDPTPTPAVLPTAPTGNRPDISARGLRHLIEHLSRRSPAVIRAALINGAIGPTLYFALLGLGLGSLVEGRAASELGGRYLDFLGPGLMAVTAIQWGFQEGLWPTAEVLRWDRTYPGVATTPATVDEIATAHALWSSSRYTGAAVLFTVVLVVFGVTASWWALFAPLAAGLTAFVTVSWVAAFTARVDNDMSYPLLLRLGMFPMFIFSGAFFPVTNLPGPVAVVVRLLPGYHGVELTRSLVRGTVDGAAGHLVYLLVAAAVGWLLLVASFRRNINGGGS